MGPAARSNSNPSTQVLTPTAVIAGPQPYGGNTVDVTLAASITVGAPVYLTGESAQPGDRLSFIFRQSGAGSFTATWNAIYKAVGVVLTTASATAVDQVQFQYDGTNWLAEDLLKGEVA